MHSPQQSGAGAAQAGLAWQEAPRSHPRLVEPSSPAVRFRSRGRSRGYWGSEVPPQSLPRPACQLRLAWKGGGEEEGGAEVERGREVGPRDQGVAARAWTGYLGVEDGGVEWTHE